MMQEENHMPEHSGDSVRLDLSESRVKAWLDALDHIDAAMALINKNDGAWSSLAQAKTAAERTLGSMLFNRARDQRNAAESGRNEASDDC